MIDWNGDGKIDAQDWIITGMILDEEEESNKKGSGKPKGSCLASLLLILSIPLAAFIIIH